MNRVVNCITPREQAAASFWKRQLHNLSSPGMSGSKGWYMITGKNVGMLENQGSSAIFIGYSDQSNPYKLLDVDKRKLVFS